MNLPSCPPRRSAFPLASAFYVAAASLALAQATSPVEESSDELLVLSPFVVDAREDAGSYQATSTLAGTRIRTDLRDVGSSVSVVTEQFMKDTAATRTEDLLVYTAGTEVGGVRGNFTGTGNGRQLGEADRLLRPNNNTRVRGLAAADNTRDFFLTDIPWDSYNVGRVDIQRGPNAILFGMGSPAGIINSSSDQASFRDENEVEIRVDSEGSLRGAINLNKVLLKEELALRFAALSDKTEFRQKPAFNRDERLYGALRYDPAFLKRNGMVTSFRANYEKGDIHSNRPRSLTPGDQFTPWFTDLNQQVFDPSAAWAIDGSGVTSRNLDDGSPNPNYSPRVGAYGNVYGNVLSYFPAGATQQAQLRTVETTGYWGLAPSGERDGGIGGEPFARQVGITTFADYMINLGDPLSSVNAYKDQRLGDESRNLFDFYNRLLDGDNKREWRGFESFNVALSQTFFDNRLGIEGVYDSQRYHDGQINGANQVIYVDINSRFLDGTANPYVGQAFVQSDNGAAEFNSESTAKRVTAFGEFRATDFFERGVLTTLLGRHVFTGMYAEEERKTTALTFNRYSMDRDYSVDVYGFPNGSTSPDKDLESNETSVTMMSYLSGDLRGTPLASAQLQGLTSRIEPVSNGQLYFYNSRWNRPTDPATPGYVDPAAPWTPPPTREGDTQADNPDNYLGWGTYPVSDFLSYTDGDRLELARRGNKAYRKVKSEAFVWQAFLLDNTLIPTVGWRRDRYKGSNREASYNDYQQIDWAQGWDYDIPADFEDDESVSYSLVARLPRFLKDKLPLGADLQVFYNRSKNFQPSPGQVDMFGDALANPTGRTKDYGFVVSLLDERLNLKVNWYETNVTNDRLRGFEFWRIAQYSTVLMQNAVRVRDKDPANDWKWSATYLNDPAITQAVFDAGSEAVFDAYASNEVFRNFVDGWGFSENLVSETNSTAATPAGIAATADTQSRGLEFELNARPTPNWNIAINASKTHATQNNIGGALRAWVEAVEGLAMGPSGDLRVWWAGDGTTMRTFWQQNVAAQYNLLQLLEGSDVPELRPWRFNLVSGYSFSEGLLKGVNIGGAYRWEDRVVTGFPVISRTNPTTGASEYVYDVNNPYYGPTENHFDFWIGYGRKLTRKIDWRIQLNIRDAFAKKELVPISVQPDGTPAAYRIPELASWQITNTFTF